MAWRDGRASIQRLLLFMASIILGIAALVSIQSFGGNLKENFTLQSKSLMGSDFIIVSRQPPTERVQQLIDSLGGANATEINFPSMVAFPGKQATKLAFVRGINGGYPFYGSLETQPPSAAIDYQGNGGALVDATLMLQYDLKVGDSIKVGLVTLPIAGSITSGPGSTGVSTSVAPPIYIPYRYIDETGLVQTGSRVEYKNYFVANPEPDYVALAKTLDPILDAENADLDTHESTGRRLGRRYNNFGKFLNLVAFIALLLGCVGIASSVHIYIKEKLSSLAVLKCLGATRKQTFLIYLIQIAGMGFLGGLIGTGIGLGLQQLFPYILKDFLPLELEVSVSLQPLIIGPLLGLVMSVLFALSPLLGTWYVSPLQALRIQEHTSPKARRVTIIVMTAILIFLFVFSFWILKNLSFALAFVFGIVVVFSVLAFVAFLFMKAVKRYFPASWGFTARQSLLNLYRPNNQTLVLLLAIGVGSFLISTLYFTRDILRERTSLEATGKTPNLILMDVQTDQTEAAAASIRNNGLPVIDNFPIVTMRVQRIKGRSVNDIREDTTSTINRWILNHEFRTTYRDSLVASETLASGEWNPEFTQGDAIPISLSDNVARDAQVVEGDTLVFNVQGVLMETVVANTRAVDWGRMQMNFSIVFPRGVLENAPQFHVLSTSAPNEKTSAKLQRELVRKFPTVSIIDVRQLLVLVQDILDKIAWVINFMAFFSILTGIIVLIGSVRNSKYQRIKENVLLRTLGAKSKQILNITALEYFYLGVLGSGIGIVLSFFGSQLLASFVFDTEFTPSWIPFLIVLPGITVLVLLIGLFNSRSVLNSPPLEVLRKEVA
ncbi:FtsX-like permease family protein [Flavobacteriaceae bacterium TP-CH-4]|uniref:FtsX-like permease family protein n=1 Tax=Pelagihabitans pacificus TaxID=2696054 RepID=A0A967E3X7_9FLAO|nr:FtsX-like permease family protein [Pelagihabitans pacificus]NHF57812.1 FtsX-like permease family protein [Pelagihabitans pacificus]